MNSENTNNSSRKDEPSSDLQDCELERMSCMLEPISRIESFRWSDDESVGCSDDEPVCWSDANPFRWSARMIEDSDEATSNDSLPSMGSDDVFGSSGPSNVFEFDSVERTEQKRTSSSSNELPCIGTIHRGAFF